VASSEVTSSVATAWCGSRARLRGTATGAARSAFACSSARGSTQPTSEIISSR
jgi:hypothetical protein